MGSSVKVHQHPSREASAEPGIPLMPPLSFPIPRGQTCSEAGAVGGRLRRLWTGRQTRKPSRKMCKGHKQSPGGEAPDGQQAKVHEELLIFTNNLRNTKSWHLTFIIVAKIRTMGNIKCWQARGRQTLSRAAGGCKAVQSS